VKRRSGLFMIPMPHLPRPAANRLPHPKSAQRGILPAAFAASGSEQARSNILRPPPAAFSAHTGRKTGKGVADFAARRRQIILIINRRDMRVAIYSSRFARVAAAFGACMQRSANLLKTKDR
jgi:hypothetical protein